MESICGSSGTRTNVARFACDQARAFPKKLVIGGKRFSQAECADEATFKAAFLAATKLDDGHPDKLYVLNDLRDPQDISAANTTGAVGEGSPEVLTEGRPGFTYRAVMGQDLFKRIRKFNKRTMPIYTIDDASNDWGAIDSENYFVGVTGKLFISENRQTTASAPVSALITVNYDSAIQYNDESYYMPLSLGEFEPGGLLDGYLRYRSNTANVFKIDWYAPTARVGGTGRAGEINLAEKYNAVIVAGLLSAGTGANYATGLALTSVAYDPTLKCLTVTFDSTAYNALTAGAAIRLKFDPVADLEAAGIVGIEGVPVLLVEQGGS